MPAPQLDIPALQAVTKTKYTQKRFNLLCYPDNPFYALIDKVTDFGGKNKVVALRNGVPQGRGPTIAVAQAAKTASIYNGFVVTRVTDYSTATITGEAIKAAKGEENTLIEALTKEIDGAIHVCMRSLAINMYKNGGGQRGQIATPTSFTFPGAGGATISVGVAQTVVLLQNITDTSNFEIGMQVGLSADDGTGGAGLRAGGATMVTITAVDRDNGLLTANVAWNTIGGAAAGDFIFQGAPNIGSDYNSMVKGLQGWIPFQPPATTDNFFSVNRSSDSRLYGLRQVGQGAPMEETFIDMAVKICREGGKPSHAFLNPLDWGQFVKALSTKAIYPRERVAPNDEPDVGFEAISFMGPKGPIKVIADLNVQKGIGWMVQLDTLALESLGEAPQILDDDGLVILRNPNADAYDVRVGYYANLTCAAPIWNGVMSF